MTTDTWERCDATTCRCKLTVDVLRSWRVRRLRRRFEEQRERQRHERLKPYILDAVPADLPNKIDINFENKIHLVGYKVEPAGKRPPATR